MLIKWWMNRRAAKRQAAEDKQAVEVRMLRMIELAAQAENERVTALFEARLRQRNARIERRATAERNRILKEQKRARRAKRRG